MFVLYAKTSGLKDGEEVMLGAIKGENITGYLKTIDSGKPVHLTTGANQVKAVPGVLVRLIINATLTGTVTILDGVTTLAIIPATTTPRTLDYKMEMATSIEVNFSGTDDVTVVYI